MGIDSPYRGVHYARNILVNPGSVLPSPLDQGIQLQLALCTVFDRNGLSLELLHGLDGAVLRDEEAQRVHGVRHGKVELLLPLRRNPHEAGDGVRTPRFQSTK